MYLIKQAVKLHEAESSLEAHRDMLQRVIIAFFLFFDNLGLLMQHVIEHEEWERDESESTNRRPKPANFWDKLTQWNGVQIDVLHGYSHIGRVQKRVIIICTSLLL